MKSLSEILDTNAIIRRDIYDARQSYDCAMGDPWRNDFLETDEDRENADEYRLSSRADEIMLLICHNGFVEEGDNTFPLLLEIEDFIRF